MRFLWLLHAFLKSMAKRTLHSSRGICAGLLIVVAPLISQAQGFDETYKVYSGDLNGDSLQDLYIKGRTSAFTLVMVDDIEVVVPIRAVPKEFVLLQNSNHTFSVHANLSTADKASVAAWSQAAATLVVRDFNVDGADDLAIKGISSIMGAPDQIVYASTVKGIRQPLAVRSVDESFRNFFTAIYDWMLNRDSLVRNQYRVVGVEPPSTVWRGYFTATASTALVNALMSSCLSDKVCAYSTTKPTGACTKSVIIYDNNGNPTGTTTLDVCQFQYHIWAYTPGTVQTAVNQTYYADAVTFADTVEDVANGQISDYGQIANSLALVNSYLGITAPIGTSAAQCEDAPAVKDIGLVGLGPLILPAGYGVYYCAVAATIVFTSAVIYVRDILDPEDDHGMFSNGLATTPSPYSKDAENEALNYVPDPFGGDCENHRQQILVLRAQVAWRYTDLNPMDKIGHAGHLKRIRILEKQLEKLEKSYREICGGEP